MIRIVLGIVLAGLGRAVTGRSSALRLACAVLAAAWLLGSPGASHAEPGAASGPGVHLASHLPAAPAMISFATPAVESQPPRLDDGSRIATPRDRGTVAADDQRPLYIAVGLVVLAAVFWWNRRQRDRFDLEDARSDASRSRHRDDERDAVDDDDADDLHAAARGDATRPDDKIEKTPPKSS
jgi:hypothetical protein